MLLMISRVSHRTIDLLFKVYPLVHFIIKIFLIENECKTPSIENIFYDKMDLKLFYVTISLMKQFSHIAINIAIMSLQLAQRTLI